MSFFGVRTRIDDKLTTVVFADSGSAQAFWQLGYLYQTESGAGNGYGAYWPLSLPTQQEVFPEPTLLCLDMDKVCYMVGAIAKARKGESEVLTIPGMTYGRREGKILFSIGEFADKPA